MHCQACDCVLNDYESTRKSLITGEYYDLCDDCFAATDIEDHTVIDRPDLLGKDSYDE